MRRPWRRAVRRLQRRLSLVGMCDDGGRVLVIAAPISLVVLASATRLAWARFFVPYLGIVAGLVLVIMFVLGWVRARRSDLYCAKLIDLCSGLEDRLACTVVWSEASALDPFQARCIEQFVLDLERGHWKLQLPRVRPRSLPLVLASSLVIAAVSSVLALRPAPPIEADARQAANLSQQQVKDAQQRVQQVKNDVTRIPDPELAQLASGLDVAVQDLQRGGKTREQALADLERIRQAAIAAGHRLGDAEHVGHGSGPVAALARELSRGDAVAIRDAVNRLIDPLAAGQLSEEEIADLVPLVERLAELAGSVDAASGERLGRSAAALRSGDQATAAASLAQAKEALPLLAKKLAQAAVARKAEAAAESLMRALADQHLAQPDDRTLAQNGTKASPLGTSATGSNGAGTQQAEHPDTPFHPPAGQGGDLQLRGVWNGKVLRQFFDGTGAGGKDAEATQLLVEHERVVEDRFRRDEVPPDYQDAVRTYFAALHQRGSQWIQPKK